MLVVLLVLLIVFLCCRFVEVCRAQNNRILVLTFCSLDACEVLLCCLVDSENRRRSQAGQGRTEEIVDPEDELFKLGTVDSESKPRR